MNDEPQWRGDAEKKETTSPLRTVRSTAIPSRGITQNRTVSDT